MECLAEQLKHFDADSEVLFACFDLHFPTPCFRIVAYAMSKAELNFPGARATDLFSVANASRVIFLLGRH
jgi:hypothetical protein